jgi:hypothetical protein
VANDIGAGALWALAGAIVTGLVGWLTQRGKNEADDSISVRNEWAKLFEAVSERCQSLEDAERLCRVELADVKERLAALEGYQSGIGKARQEAANIVALERRPDKDKP